MIASLSVSGSGCTGGGAGGGGGGGAAPAGGINGGSGGNGVNSGSGGGPGTTGSRAGRGLALHRSNSSLELPHSPEPGTRILDAPLRREYGSHGSIDVAAQSTMVGDNLFVMLQELRSPANCAVTKLGSSSTAVTSTASGSASGSASSGHEQRAGAGSSSDYLRRLAGSVCQDGLQLEIDEVCGPAAHVNSASGSTTTGSTSPKLRLKINRLWGAKSTTGTSSASQSGSVLGIARALDENCATSTVSADLEERHRRRAFAHYDSQSLTANLGYAAKLRGILLARRRNTATGASAASTLRSSTPDETPEEDGGDGKGNDLLESCPYFRNEIGGEGEREVALTRCFQGNGVHRPSFSYGISVLEPAPGETTWKQTCPLARRPLPIESIDEGAHYYRRYFLGREHQNWFGMDEQLGPVAISIRKDVNQYRLIIRTSELLTLRGSVPEETLGVRPQGRMPTRELLELVAPEVQHSCLRLGTVAAEDAIARLDEQGLSTRYKVGVLYCRSGQKTEEEMYNNQHAGPAFLEFLDIIGQRIRLRGFEGYKAGLDTRTDSTGTHAVTATHRGAEVTFHVSTMLPFTPNNRQQLLRKRHIGNDIVTIVFQEPGALSFSPRRIRSQFQHVFIIVRAINPCSENTQYSVAVARSKEVPIFGPPVPLGATFTKGKAFADFILAKVINAENAAHRSEKFATMATRTRQEYLKDLAMNYSSTTLVDTGQKFSMLSFSSKKKNAVRPKLSCDAAQRGAICWQVILEDSNQNTDCYLGVSGDTIVMVEEHSRQIVFVTACISVLGWHAQTSSLRLYYHQGECITIHVRADYGERDELMEIVARLRAVTQGASATELSLKRNTLGQLGFHVQPDGVVTQVESMGLSWQAGLRQGSRLVEICKVAVSTLSHDQMVDLLKTSVQVTVTVIPANNDGSPRRGCTLQSCQYLSTNYEGDYENLTNSDSAPSQQTAMSHQRRYERSFSPPRSSNSSGYGTGSSSRSFNDPRFPLEGTMTSSSSGHSSTDDHWYDLLEAHESAQENGYRMVSSGTPPPPPPPPVPARLNYQMATSKPSQKKEKESLYATTRQFAESTKLHALEQYAHTKENNYALAKLDNGKHDYYQKPPEAAIHRAQELHARSTNYVKIQKDKYDMQQESAYVSQRELQLHLQLQLQHQLKKSDSSSQHHSGGAQQKLGTSILTPLHREPQSHNLSKSSASSCSSQYSEHDQIRLSGKYEFDCDYEEQCESKHDRAFKYELPEEKLHHKVLTPTVYDHRPEELDEKAAVKYEHDMRKYDVECQQNITHERRLDERNGTEGQVEKAERSDSRGRHESSEYNRESMKFPIEKSHSQSQKASLEYRQTREFSGGMSTEVNVAEVHRLPSEDELSNGSGSVSPRLRRASKHRTGNVTPSNGSSRNQSPRPKPSIRNSHRNSANLTTSTLQEDLIRLISPDYIGEDGGHTSNNNNSVNNTATTINQNACKLNNNMPDIQNRCRSRENLCVSSTTSGLSVLPTNGGQETSNNPAEVILTTARPATVISNASTASSPAPSENKLSKEERLSPRVTKPLQLHPKQQQSARGLSGKDVKSDVEARVEEDCWDSHHEELNSRSKQYTQEWKDDRYIDGCNAVGNAVSDLQSHLSTLELRVARETRRRISLEDEVRRLRDENRRLQDESHAAVQQLRRFTEWFFQTIDHQ